MKERDSESARHLWLNGKLTAWDTATVHLTALGSLINIGMVGEGIQAYLNAESGRLFVFRLVDHMKRLNKSMKLQHMECSFSPGQLAEGSVDLLKADRLREDSYISPRAFFDPLVRGRRPFVEDPASTQIMIWAGSRPSQLSSPQSLHCCVSSWSRVSDNVIPFRIKCLSNYQNCRLAAWEAYQNGYDDAIMIDPSGKVTEATSACLFIVRDGVAVTPAITNSILESITRRTFIELFKNELGITTVEREIDRTELYIADEAFLCGTSEEVKPIASIDRYTLGACPGPVTESIRRLYHDVVRGKVNRYEHWLTEVA